MQINKNITQFQTVSVRHRKTNVNPVAIVGLECSRRRGNIIIIVTRLPGEMAGKSVIRTHPKAVVSLGLIIKLTTIIA